MKLPESIAGNLDQQRSDFCDKLVRHANQAESSSESRLGGNSRRVMSELRRGNAEHSLRHIFNPDSMGTEGLLDEGEVEVRLLIAKLFAHHRKNRVNPWLNFGASMKLLADKSAPDAMERRFLRLIGAKKNQYPEVLRQCVLLSANHGVGINWFLLLCDSAAFLSDDEDRRKGVIRRWCRGFYTGRSSESSNLD